MTTEEEEDEEEDGSAATRDERDTENEEEEERDVEDETDAETEDDPCAGCVTPTRLATRDSLPDTPKWLKTPEKVLPDQILTGHHKSCQIHQKIRSMPVGVMPVSDSVNTLGAMPVSTCIDTE